MTFSRLFGSLVRPVLVASALVLAPVAASPALAQRTPVTAQAPAAQGDAHGPAREPGRGRTYTAAGGRRDERITPAQRIERRVRRMVERLGLDPTQEAQVRTIMLDARGQHGAATSEGLTREQRQERHRAAVEANGQRIRSILRPDQRQRFDALQAAERSAR